MEIASNLEVVFAPLVNHTASQRFSAGDPAGYARTLARFSEALEVETLVPGHGQITSEAILGRYLDYLQTLVHAARAAHRHGWTLEETLELTPLWDRFTVPPDLPSEAFYTGLHPYNLQRAYLELEPKK